MTRHINRKGIGDITVWFFSVVLFIILIAIFFFIAELKAETLKGKYTVAQGRVQSNQLISSYLQYPVDPHTRIIDAIAKSSSSSQLKAQLERPTEEYLGRLKELGLLHVLTVAGADGKVMVDEDWYVQKDGVADYVASQTVPTLWGPVTITLKTRYDDLYRARCSSLKDNLACANTLQCYWESASCENCVSKCSKYSEQATCTADPCFVGGCSWDSAKGACRK